MNKKQIYLEFNETYFEFINFLKEASNDNKEFKSFYNKNLLIKQTNIKFFIKSWYSYITTLYYHKIMKDDITFFLNKDFSSDKKNIDNSYCNSFDKTIEFLKSIYQVLDKKIIELFLNYVKKLTHFSYLYYN